MNNQGLFKALKKDIIFSILGISVLNPVYKQVPQTMLFYKTKKEGGGNKSKTWFLPDGTILFIFQIRSEFFCLSVARSLKKKKKKRLTPEPASDLHRVFSNTLSKHFFPHMATRPPYTLRPLHYCYDYYYPSLFPYPKKQAAMSTAAVAVAGHSSYLPTHPRSFSHYPSTLLHSPLPRPGGRTLLCEIDWYPNSPGLGVVVDSYSYSYYPRALSS